MEPAENIKGAYPPKEPRRGQTLAEFAISLPLLLILLFGIIEFGRMFQSWVTIQNSARTAARYAVTGQYDETRYSLDSVPCSTTNYNSDRETYLAPLFLSDSFTLQRYQDRFGADWEDYLVLQDGQLYQKVDVYVENPASPPGQSEHLFETYYGVDDCFPDDQALQRRKDLLRLPSIYDAARIGAAGVSLDDSLTNTEDGETQAQMLERFLYTTFSNPSPELETQRWFNLVVCSSRARLFGNDFSEIPNNPDDNPADINDAVLRYYTAYSDPFFPAGACVLEERIKDTSDPVLLRNYRVPWMDAGGPGERVTIIVTYNHPLVTPLGLAPFVRMQAVRAAVNETFRVTNAERALGPSGTSGSDFVPPTPEPDTATPTLTLTPLPTDIPTETSTASSTPTPEPFTCDRINLLPISFADNKVRVFVRNQNPQDTYLTGAVVYWDKVRFPEGSLRFMTFDTQIFWMGEDTTPPADTRAADGSTENGTTFISPTQPFWVFGDPLMERDANLFEGIFNGTNRLSDVFDGWEFEGSELFFDNPDSGTDCVKRFVVPPPPPTNTPVPDDFTPTATFTPDCASSLMRIEFVRFDPNGDVVLRVVNNRTVSAPFRGFELRWPAWRAAGLRLVKMTVGGTSADDITDNGGTGTRVWRANDGAGYRPTGVVIGNPEPPTITPSYDETIGLWLDPDDPYDVAYVFPPQSETLLFIDFTGVGVSTLESRGVSPSDFNLSRFRIECGRDSGRWGGTGGSGGGSWSGGGEGELILSNINTPAPTPTPRPTNTPGPSPTPSKTFTPAPPTLTPTPGPPTATRTPSPTFVTSTFTPTRTPTEPTFGGAD